MDRLCSRLHMCVLFLFFLVCSMPVAKAAEPPPYVPLAAPGNIENLQYTTDGTGYFIQKDGKNLTHVEISGRQWIFNLPWQDWETGKQALKKWLDAEHIDYVIRENDAFLGHKKMDPSCDLYFRIDTNPDAYRCEIVEKRTLSYDRPITLRISPEDPTAYFYTRHKGTTMDRLEIDGTAFSPADPENHLELDIGAVLKVQQGKLSRSIDFSTWRETREETYWEISNMPQLAGTYRWSLSLRAGEDPPEFKIMLIKGRSIPSLKAGDRLGGLLVKNVPFGAATAVPEYNESNEFPGFTENNRVGDVTPNGEALFWLPPGMWSIHVNPLDQTLDTSLLKSHFIPVQPGELTRVEWPKSLNDVFTHGKAGKMKILAAQADESKAGVEIALLGTDRKQIVPTLENTEIAEGGQKVKITAVERIQTPADIVLLLDSSGSMRGQMNAAINATKKFVSGLPEQTRIRIIDFDTHPRLLNGQTSRQVIKSLSSVKANGATALYDSILEGLDLLRSKDRPALVVFTDGVDANHNDTGPGSKATQEEVIEAVLASTIPVFTIGFGEKSDVNTLSRIADISGGEYFIAPDEDKLGQVFERINNNLGSQYRISYTRPKTSGVSNRPVMSIMVDNSGSMDSWPDECSGCDKRMEKTRQLLRKFVTTLPDDFLIQISTFSGEVIVEQVLTSDKPSILRAISQMEGRSTTNILGSMAVSLRTLQAVPSTRRYLVYLADAALDVDDDEKEMFNAVLGKISDAKISTLFIGMVGDDEAKAFENAAQKTNGDFIVSKDFNKLGQRFKTLSQKILEEPKTDDISLLRVNMTHRLFDGENIIYSAAKQVKFPGREKSNGISAPEEVIYTPGGPLQPYDADLSRLVSGTDVMMKDVRVIKRLPLDLTAKNKAVKIRLKEALSLSRFRGIDAPDHLRYFALTLSFENILPSQKVAVYPDGANHPAAWVGGNDKPLRYEQRIPTYLIPDVTKHFFLRWNNARSYPVSPVTWLAESPLTLPDDSALRIEPGEKVEGTLMFMVPSDHMKQSSLHLYDTHYGHLEIPISGILKTTKEDIEKLPVKEPARLSDAFGFSVEGFRVTDRIGQTTTDPDTSFVIVDGSFTSNVQAHLNIDPKERFYLKIPTKKGHLFLSPHPTTTLLPLGFFAPTLVTPGTKNPVRLAFNVPQPLLENLKSASIFIDIFNGAVEIPLYGGKSKPPAVTFQADGTDKNIAFQIINSGQLSPDTDIRLGDNLVAVEAVIKDKKDKLHSQIGELIILKNKNFDPQKAAETEKELERLRREAATLPQRGLANFGQSTLKVVPGMLQAIPNGSYIIGGLDEESLVPDGQTVHGVFLFDIGEETRVSDWEISSLVIPDIAIPLSDGPYQNNTLFAKKRDMENEITASFQEALEEKLLQINSEREAFGFKKPGSLTVKSISPENDTDRGQRIPPQSLTAAGAEDMAAMKTLDDFEKALEKIRFLPSGAYTSWIYQYLPEAVLSQGWGTENDLALMLENILTRTGYATVRTAVDLTDTGRTALAKLAGLESCELEVLPAVRFTDEKGEQKTIVSPFMKDTKELGGLVIEKPAFKITEDNTENVGLTITLLLRATGNSNTARMADIVDTLGGGNGGELYSITVFSDSLPLPPLSKDAVDIGYTKIPVDGSLAVQAIVDTPWGRMKSQKESCVPLNDFDVVGEIIRLQTPDQTFTKKRMLSENEKITGLFHTLGINLSDITEAQVAKLNASAKARQESVQGEPDALSALKWANRTALARFISAQSAYEKKLAHDLDLVIGRTQVYRLLMVNVIKAEDDTPISVHMDLIYPHNRILRAPDEIAKSAFNILSGIAATRFEANALGRKGIGLYQIWQKMSPETVLIGVGEDNRDDFVNQLEEKEYPSSLIDYFNNLDYKKIVFFPSSPALVNGKPRWAWLEFNKETYQVVSVLDTGENGSMVENAIGNPAEQAGQYMVGVLTGIDVSMWSVAAFSLIMDDYAQILKEAEKFAKNMADNFGVGVKIGDLAIGVDVGGSPAASYGRGPKAELSPTDSKLTNNILGFGNGYSDGVARYFNSAKN